VVVCRSVDFLVDFLAVRGWLGLVCHHARGEGRRRNVDCGKRREGWGGERCLVVCILSELSMRVGLVGRWGGIRRVGRWYFFTFLTHYDSHDGKAGQGNGWMMGPELG